MAIWSMDEYMKYLAELLPEKDSLKLVKNEAALPLIKEWLNSLTMIALMLAELFQRD